MLACVVLLLLGAVTVMGRSDGGLEMVTATQKKMNERLTHLEKTVAEMKSGMMMSLVGQSATHSSAHTSSTRKPHYKKHYSDNNTGSSLYGRRSSGGLSTSGMKHGHSGKQSMSIMDFMSNSQGMQPSSQKMQVSGPDGKQLSEDDPMYKAMKQSFGSGQGMDLGSLFSGTSLTVGGKEMDLGSMMNGASVKVTGSDGRRLSKDDPQYKRMMGMAGGNMNFANMLQSAMSMAGEQSNESPSSASSSLFGSSLFG